YRREPPRFRLHIDRRRDEADQRAQAGRRQDRRSRGPRTGMGLRKFGVKDRAAKTETGVETMSKAPKYFMYFPGNYRWSAAFVTTLARGACAGADTRAGHRSGRLLDGKQPEDDAAWFAACVTAPDEVRSHGERFAAAGHPVPAAAFSLRACHYYQMGE